MKPIPSECTNVLVRGDAHFGLIPTASYLQHKQKLETFSSYGIACDGAVKTVSLFTDSSIENIDTIFLDNHSRTSVALIKVLCDKFWDIAPEFIDADVSGRKLDKGQAKLMIGDKVFFEKESFRHVYDLGAVWKEFTGLPFVFALWVKQRNFDSKELESLLTNGMNDIFSTGISDIVKNKKNDHPTIDLHRYLTDNIKFKLTKKSLESIDKFEAFLKEMELIT